MLATTSKPLTGKARLYKILRAALILQSREVSSRVRSGILTTPDLDHWVPALVKMVTPLLKDYYAEGMVKVAVSLGVDAVGNMPRNDPDQILLVAKAVRRSVDVLHRNRTPAGFNPKVIQAVDDATLRLCRETIETITTDVDSALEDVRSALKRHLRYSTRYGPQAKRGELTHILSSLGKNIEKVVSDPYRAYRIATTEYHRAVNAGAVLEAKQASFNTLKVWHTSASACNKCRKLNGRRRKLDTTFTTVDGAGPYRDIQHPPLHPNCECQLDIIRAKS